VLKRVIQLLYRRRHHSSQQNFGSVFRKSSVSDLLLAFSADAQRGAQSRVRFGQLFQPRLVMLRGDLKGFLQEPGERFESC